MKANQHLAKADGSEASSLICLSLYLKLPTRERLF